MFLTTLTELNARELCQSYATFFGIEFLLLHKPIVTYISIAQCLLRRNKNVTHQHKTKKNQEGLDDLMGIYIYKDNYIRGKFDCNSQPKSLLMVTIRGEDVTKFYIQSSEGMSKAL